MADIFISYKKEDAGRVIRMVEALRAEGFDVWWDHGIQAGSEWDRSIHKELYAAKVVIAIWSKASVAAPWVKEEATVGKNRGVLLPAKIDEVDPPLGFMMIQAADLVGWRGDRTDQRWAFFLAAVQGILRGGSALAARGAGAARVAPEKPAAPSDRRARAGRRRRRRGRARRAAGLTSERGAGGRRSGAARGRARRPPRRRPPPRITESEQKLWDKAVAEKTPPGASSPICSPIPTAPTRSGRATRCSPAAPRRRRSGKPARMSPTRWYAASPAARCRPA